MDKNVKVSVKTLKNKVHMEFVDPLCILGVLPTFRRRTTVVGEIHSPLDRVALNVNAHNLVVFGIGYPQIFTNGADFMNIVKAVNVQVVLST